jgi:hypothetical protein
MPYDKHALIPVILCASVWDTRWYTTRPVNTFAPYKVNKVIKVTYTGRIRRPSFMMQLMYGRS